MLSIVSGLILIGVAIPYWEQVSFFFFFFFFFLLFLIKMIYILFTTLNE